MLDEATAAAEAMTLCLRVGKREVEDVLRRRRRACRRRSRSSARAPSRSASRSSSARRAAAASHDAFGVLLQYPGAYGDVLDYRARRRRGPRARRTRRRRGRPARADAADAARRMGRGRRRRHEPALRRADGLRRTARGLLRDARRVQAQHARPARRRDRRCATATAPIASRCRRASSTSAARRRRRTSARRRSLLAVMAGMYAVYHGPDGLATIARRVHRLATVLAAGLRAARHRRRERRVLRHATSIGCDAGVRPRGGVRAARQPAAASTRHHVGVSLDETTTRADVERLWLLFAHGRPLPDFDALDATADDALPATLVRTSRYLTHPVFNTHHSETEMLRYLRRLADKDIALDRAMIPLGSCTMKLNATSEMIPVTWPRVRAHASVRAAGADGRLSRDDRRARGHAVRGDRLRRRLAAAERRLAGRVRGPAR